MNKWIAEFELEDGDRMPEHMDLKYNGINIDFHCKPLEQKPYEKFDNVKQHIHKLASDYKCWDNRLTHEEVLELCHILDQELTKDEVILTQKEYRELVSSAFSKTLAIERQNIEDEREI